MAETVVVAPAPDSDVAALEAEAASDAADAAVEIARINAERDVAIAETHADAAVEQKEAQAAAVIATAPEPVSHLEERVEECLRRSETIQTTVQSILARLDQMQSPPPPPPPVDDANALTPDNQEAPETPKPKRPKFKLI